MTPWLADPDVTLYHGDCLEVLRELPSGSVHMCATSPPFYGLRDYGTGEWEGGDPDCDHMRPPNNPDTRSTLGTPGHPAGGNTHQNHSREPWPNGTCGKCGARRVDRQIGLEETPDEWVARLVDVFREVRRVLRDDGTLWVEIGDSYAGGPPGGAGKQDTNRGSFGIPSRPHPSKQKDLLGQPWLLAFALRADGWYLRSEIIWARPNPMPESVTDRPTKAHSTVFLLSKQPRYYWDQEAIRERYSENTHGGNGRDGGAKLNTVHKLGSPNLGHRPEDRPHSGANARSVWTVPTEPTPFAHFATWPQALVRRMILAGSPEGGVVLDPFSGSGTTSLVARNHGRHSIGIELNEQYLEIAAKRLQQLSLLA